GVAEGELDRPVIEDVDGMGPLVEHRGRGAAIVLVAPSDVLGGNRRAVVKLETGAELKGRALAVFGEVERLGKREMFVFLVAEILDQRILVREQEIVRGRRPVMLLRVEPARGDVAVPGE